MAAGASFQHLQLLLRFQGDAKLPSGGNADPQTVANKSDFKEHAKTLSKSAKLATENWRKAQEERKKASLPIAPKGMPVLLRVDPGLELDELREKFQFEIVSEQAGGFVIVGSEDIQLDDLREMVEGFGNQAYGSAKIASIHELSADPSQSGRLQRVLSESLLEQWPSIKPDQDYICDIGLSALGTQDIPKPPVRGKRDTDASWATKEAVWAQARADAYQAWDDLKIVRENEVSDFVDFYNGRILNIIDGIPEVAGRLPDSFTVRVKLPGRGLRDLVMNVSYVFEVVEPDDVELPQHADLSAQSETTFTLLPPEPDAPAVCVIDSGIQEEHRLLRPAIDGASSHSFLPGSPGDVSDYVKPGGHGTRVAGAVLFGDSVPQQGQHSAVCWLQNARVLDRDCRLPLELFPPLVLRLAITRFHLGERATRIFNHSINSLVSCRTRHMSAWAAEIDEVSHRLDVLVIQSAGNIPCSGPNQNPGVKEHITAGRTYPEYLHESASRIANPAQSLQALTVGSLAFGAFSNAAWSSVATGNEHSSAFSRTGPGIWDAIKPEVVEFGGDYLRTASVPPDVTTPTSLPEAYPELVRSTMYPPGPEVDRDAVGTSFCAPKVANIAAQVERALPDDNCLLYRALIVQSARWPAWASAAGADAFAILKRIGYGVPDQGRATGNSDYRTTLVASKDPSDAAQDLLIKAGEGHVYQVPIPEEMRRPGDEFDVLIEVTLAYSAQPRRTRRNLRRYHSTWVDWTSSKLEESLESFRARALKGQADGGSTSSGTPIPWALHEKPQWGRIRGIKRSSGATQKDWATVKSSQLPESFCVSVRGHKGWSRDPDSTARYALAVSFEMLGREVTIYEPILVAVEELQAEVEAQAQVEIRLPSELD